VFAHINIWPLNAKGGLPDNTAAREIAARMSQQPGFRTYSLVRTGDREVVAITMYDTEAHLEEAVRAVANLVHQRVGPLSDGTPERRRGEVLYHTSARTASS
jgi:heme-degrading monooxygenase HmoA